MANAYFNSSVPYLRKAGLPCLRALRKQDRWIVGNAQLHVRQILIV